MKNIPTSYGVLVLLMLLLGYTLNGQCSDELVNQSSSITLSPGYIRSGADGATGIQIGSICGLRVYSDPGARWGRYEIPISVADNGLLPGDQIEISMDVTNITANFLYDLKGDSNVLDWSTEPVTGRIITVPSGITSMIIRLFTNHDQSDVGGSFDVSNLSVSKVGAQGNENLAPTVPSNVAATDNGNGTATISWTSSSDDDGISYYRVFADENTDGGYVEIGTSAVTNFTSNSLNNSQYIFTVVAVDNSAENLESDLSSASNIITITNSSNTGGGGSSIWTENNTTASYSGEVAIGRSTVPSGYQLAVDGNIRTREVRVDQDNWPDYVFKEGYHLLSLEEIQKHITEKGHLPNIPSAKEVELNGMPLGEMDRLLLEKIEELTLHILRQEEKIKMQQKQINILKNNSTNQH